LSWWVASLSVPELKGWLEIDDDWRPISCGVVDDLRWVAPPGAGNGWTMTYDKEFAAGDSYKVRAQRDRRPPGSKKGVVKLDGDAVIAEFVFYRLARWLGLPAPPVQFIIVPSSVPSRLDWERDIYADHITPEIDAVLSALEQRKKQVRYSDRRAGASIWWIGGQGPSRAAAETGTRGFDLWTKLSYTERCRNDRLCLYHHIIVQYKALVWRMK
jgi:hypothetical protein